MLPEALEEREIIFWPHVAYEMKSMDLGEYSGVLFGFIGELYRELQQSENLLCLFIAFFPRRLFSKLMLVWLTGDILITLAIM